MTIEEIFNGIEYKILNKGEAFELKEIEYDSRKVSEGTIFAALEGAKSDGHDFIKTAIKAGAKMIIVSKEVPIEDDSLPYILVENLRQKLGIIASNYYGWPQDSLKIVGITGTKGKTTSTYLIETILGASKTARIGTIEYKIGDEIIEANNTTPESLDVVKICKKAKEKGMEYLVMEVSSHALDMGRVEMLNFDAVSFTNLTQDHLDYHKNMESYFNTKLRIFDKLKNKENGVINVDDSWISKVAPKYNGFIKYSLENGNLIGKIDWLKTDKMGITIEYQNNSYSLETELIGKFNLYNILGAIGIGLKVGMSMDDIIERLKMAKKVPGRLEVVSCGQDFTVVVDYAHTDASLTNVLQALNEIKKGRIITVFGAGGDRDKSKRPKMAKAAAALSDYVIITSDNPRTEDPLKILEDVEAGMKEVGYTKYNVVENRTDAIKKAVEIAVANDTILIAGKGHETYQIIGTVKHHFDDREESAKYIRLRMVKN